MHTTLIAALIAASSLATRLGLPADAKLLIVHGDDLGVAHSVNEATSKAFETGLVNSASVMVPTPWLPEIAKWAREHPNADIGLHLTLTSEWTPMKWRPLTGGKSLVDMKGFFYSSESAAASHMDPKEAEAEIRAQIAAARALGIHPTHVDSHMGTLYQNQALFAALLRVAREEHLPARIWREQLTEPFRAALVRDDDIVIDQLVTPGNEVPFDQWREWYAHQIRNIKPGLTEIVAHLGYDDAELRAITVDHPSWGAAWRQRDFDFLTSDEFRRLLAENNIHLVTWRDLAKSRNAVVFMGDSITEVWGKFFESEFPGKPYINRGISGQTTPQMLARFQHDVVDVHPDVVVILAGINDIAGNTGPETPEMIEQNIASMAEQAHANKIGVVLCSILPANRIAWRPQLTPAAEIIAINAWMKKYAAKNHFVYVDYWSAMADAQNGLPPSLSTDGVHPNEAGYKIMAPLVERGITQARSRGRYTRPTRAAIRIRPEDRDQARQ